MCSLESTPKWHFFQVSLFHRPVNLRCDLKFPWPVSTCNTSLILYLGSCSSSYVSRQVDIPPHLRENVFQSQFHTCFLQKEYDTGIVGWGPMKGLSVASFASWALVHLIFTFVWVDKVWAASMHRCTEELLTRDPQTTWMAALAVQQEDSFLSHVSTRTIARLPEWLPALRLERRWGSIQVVLRCRSSHPKESEPLLQSHPTFLGAVCEAGQGSAVLVVCSLQSHSWMGYWRTQARSNPLESLGM